MGTDDKGPERQGNRDKRVSINEYRRARREQQQGGGEQLERVEQLARKHLGQMLVEAGLIEASQLHKALTVQTQHGGDAVRILISLGYIDVDQFLDFLASHPAMHRFDLANYELDPALVQLIPRQMAEHYEIAPIDRDGDTLRLGVVRPLPDSAIADIERQTGLRVRTLLCARDDIQAVIRRYFAAAKMPAITPENVHELSGPLKLSLLAGLIRDIDSFPALPETVHRAKEAMDDPHSSIPDVGRIVIMDPPIAAKVLSVANSAAYGFPRQIEDINLAISLLGLRETYTIILSAAVLNLLEKTKHFDYKRFWVEAICCAAASRFVIKASGRKRLSGSFAAALLHDIGRVALAEIAPGLYSRLTADYTGDELLEEEERTLGITHMEAGYELAMHWELPPEIAEPIRFHHRPQDAEHAKEAVAVVSLADAMARAAGATLEENKGLFEPHSYALELLGLDEELAEAMLDEFLSRRDESLRESIE